MPRRPAGAARPSCSIDGCSKAQKYAAKGWCQTHYHRWWRTGTTDLNPRPLLSPEVTYRAAHTRASHLWGSATAHPCIGCGADAAEWAYDGTDPTELEELAQGRYPIKYSAWPEFYMPMCHACHRLRDASTRWGARTHFPRCGHPRTVENINWRRNGKSNGCLTCKLAADRSRHHRKKESRCPSSE